MVAFVPVSVLTIDTSGARWATGTTRSTRSRPSCKTRSTRITLNSSIGKGGLPLHVSRLDVNEQPNARGDIDWSDGVLEYWSGGGF